jgi:hypothetical protein
LGFIGLHYFLLNLAQEAFNIIGQDDNKLIDLLIDFIRIDQQSGLIHPELHQICCPHLQQDLPEAS